MLLNTKTGSSMMELIVVGVIVVGASLFVLENNLAKIDFKDGGYDANKAEAVLNDVAMQHPINSMIRPQLYDISASELSKINEIKLRQGFSEVSQEALNDSKNRYFKNGITSEKTPITVAASKQFLTLSTKINSKEICAGFVSTVKGNGGWTSISINGRKLKLSIASGGEVATLCGDNSAGYNITLEYCQPTAILTCA